jgi:uncharacterized membrane protein YphA (DoxX/SURF4 family)
MKYGRYGWPYLFLRVGLGLTFLYIGLDIWRHPDMWIGYVPSETMFGLTRESMLRFGGLFDLVIGVLLVTKVMPKLAGALAVLHLVGIFTLNGIDAVLVRNVGLLGAALAVAVWPSSYHRRKRWWGNRMKKRSGEEAGD